MSFQPGSNVGGEYCSRGPEIGVGADAVDAGITTGDLQTRHVEVVDAHRPPFRRQAFLGGADAGVGRVVEIGPKESCRHAANYQGGS